ncbi:MAG: hypothetical protein ACP5NC_03095 [Nitrososphaeria archaeon]
MLSLSKNERIAEEVEQKEDRVKEQEEGKLLLAKRWQDYDNIKGDWQWNLAKILVSRYDLIAYENLSVSNMMKNHNLAKAI